MEKKNIRKARFTRAERQEEKTIAVETLQESKSTDMSVRDDKMAAQNVAAKGKKRVRRSGKKTKVQIVTEPEAGPSGLGTSEDKAVVEKTNFMVVCKYKLPETLNLKPTKPYQVRWGNDYLKTLLPNPKQRSILKKSSADGKKKPLLKFSQTTVYYFERVQRHSTMRTDADAAVDMKLRHFYSNILPVDTYESQKYIRRKRNLDAMFRRDVHRLVLPTSSNERDKILHTIHVPVELIDEDHNKIIAEKDRKPCSCNLYCDPDICECNLTGKKCEVFKDGFTCGCLLEYCKNTNGREAINNDVQKNIVTVANSGIPAPETKDIMRARINKRKQLVPIRYTKY